MLLLFLIASPLLHSHLFIYAASTSPPITRPRIIFMTALGSDNDYSDYDENTPPTQVVYSERIPDVHRETQLCQYNSCLENQEPCAQLSERTGCLCPGVSGPELPPQPPLIHTLLPIREGENKGKIEVQWCAPSSEVSGYRLVIEGRDALDFRNTQRRGLVGSLDVGTKVCVEAVNRAGYSPSSEFSCQRYDPPKSSDHNLLAWLIGGGVALLLVIIITAVTLRKCKKYLKGKKDSTDGLGNPSYSAEGTL